MTTRHALMVTAFAAAFAMPTEAAAESGAEAEIRELHRQLVQAYLRGDGVFFENLYADDATIVHSDGELHTKADDPEIKAMKSGAWKYETIEPQDLNIRTYGDAAVAVYRANVTGVFDGKPAKFQGRAVRVWAKKNGQWKTVAFQFARVAQPK